MKSNRMKYNRINQNDIKDKIALKNRETYIPIILFKKFTNYKKQTFILNVFSLALKTSISGAHTILQQFLEMCSQVMAFQITAD